MSTAEEIAALKEATREAHEALKDLRTEHRAVRQMLDGIEGRTRRAVETLMEEALKRELAALGTSTDMAMRKSVAKVTREFDRLEAILLGKEHPGRASIPELIERLPDAKRAVHWEVTP